MSINIGFSVTQMGRKKVTKEQLDEVIKAHGLWIKDHQQGKRAELIGCSFGIHNEETDIDLSGVDLSGADLSGSSFFKIKLVGINLSGSNLDGASFLNVDLTDAVLDDATLRSGTLAHSNLTRIHAEHADFTGSCLWDNDYSEGVFAATRFIGAQLCDGNFKSAELCYCDFRFADIDYAQFEQAELTDADMRWTKSSYLASFKGANMRNTNIEGSPIDDEAVEGAVNLFVPMVCPEEGSFIAWKKCRDGKIAKIQITENALRTGGNRDDCRASEVLIIDIFDGDNSCEEAVCIDDENKIYHKGELLKDEEEFDASLLHDGKGIHFFITRAEAERAEYKINDEESEEEDSEDGD